jgi:hypothetical protein
MRGQIVIHSMLVLAIIAAADTAPAQERKTMKVDIAQLASNLEGEFTQWRTGEGDPAAWTVVADASAEGGRAIAQVSKDKTNYRFPLAIYRPFSARDVEVSVRFKPVAGTVDQAGGIAVRLQTPDDYYVVRANALEHNVRFYRVVAGRREQLHGADLKVASDNAFDGPGKVALWTKADSVTHFDTLAITPLD